MSHATFFPFLFLSPTSPVEPIALHLITDTVDLLKRKVHVRDTCVVQGPAV